MEQTRSAQEDSIAQLSANIHQEMERFDKQQNVEFKIVMQQYCQNMLDFHTKNLNTWKEVKRQQEEQQELQ